MIDLVQPAADAVTRVRGILFEPFRAGKWFALGFTSWLAGFLSGSSTSVSFRNVPSTDSEDWTWTGEAVSAGFWVWLAVLAAVFLILALVVLVLSWLGARGRFMFLDNVLQNRALIAAPWKAFRVPANSLFRLHAIVFLVNWLLFFLLAVAAIWVLWPDFEKQTLRGLAVYLPLILAGCALLAAWFAVGIVMFFLREFGVPVMMKTGCSAFAALRDVGVMASHRPVDFIVYLFARIAMEIVLFMLIFAIGCLTCCLGFLPYLGAVITLPLGVFRLCYSLNCLSQFGVTLWPSNLLPPPAPGTLP